MSDFAVEHLYSVKCTEWEVDGKGGELVTLRRAFSGDKHEYQFDFYDLNSVKSLVKTLSMYIELADGGEG